MTTRKALSALANQLAPVLYHLLELQSPICIIGHIAWRDRLLSIFRSAEFEIPCPRKSDLCYPFGQLKYFHHDSYCVARQSAMRRNAACAA